MFHDARQEEAESAYPLKKSEDAHQGEAEWAYPLSRWVGAAALERALPVHQRLEQQEQEPELPEPQKQERQEPERPAQEPALRGAAQHYRKKK